uniref:Peptidase A1 domain-containing protein n=1 Tax=Oryza punctata TaxID=4537 RepID=A0A0E0MA71_ORYPU
MELEASGKTAPAVLDLSDDVFTLDAREQTPARSGASHARPPPRRRDAARRRGRAHPLLTSVLHGEIGTPPQPVSGIIDVGGELVWTQCSQYCRRCFKQDLPLFDTDASSMFRPEPCGAAVCQSIPTRRCSGDGGACGYEASTSFGRTVGRIGTDTVAIGTAATKSLAFGCRGERHGHHVGILRVRRAREDEAVARRADERHRVLLLPAPDTGKSSALFLGASAKLAGAGKNSTTPFVKTSTPPNSGLSRSYLLRLEAIKAGNATIAMSQSGNTIMISTATPVTALVDSVYQDLRKAVTDAVGAAPVPPPVQNYDLCSPKASASGAPDLVLAFQGGAAMTMPVSSYLFDAGNDTACVAILGSPALGGVSILGSLQQENIHFLFDLDKEMLSFEPADCSTLS